MSYGGGGGGCAWPLDQFFCQQGNARVAIKYTVCPTANQVGNGNAVGEFYNGGPIPFDLFMIQYLSPISYSDQSGSVVVLVDDVTVDYGAAIYSATNC